MPLRSTPCRPDPAWRRAFVARREALRARRARRRRRSLGAPLALAAGLMATAAAAFATAGPEASDAPTGALNPAASPIAAAGADHAIGAYARERRAEARERARAQARARARRAEARRRAARIAASVPAQLRAIAICESHGNPAAIGGGGRYRGKYQFDMQTWAANGGTGDPAAAPEHVQDQIAMRLYARRGSAPWANCA